MDDAVPFRQAFHADLRLLLFMDLMRQADMAVGEGGSPARYTTRRGEALTARSKAQREM
jgi:hypothetical protein